MLPSVLKHLRVCGPLTAKGTVAPVFALVNTFVMRETLHGECSTISSWYSMIMEKNADIPQVVNGQRSGPHFPRIYPLPVQLDATRSGSLIAGLRQLLHTAHNWPQRIKR